MLETILNTMAGDLTCLPFLTKVGGLARAQKITTGSQVKTVPVALNLAKGECNPNDYAYLVPDSAEVGIAYFEASGTRTISSDSHADHMDADVRLVVWLNLSKITPPDTGLLAMVVAQKIKPVYGNLSCLSRICTTFLGEEVKSPGDIFGRYSYREEEVQFLMYPYDYFALRFRVNFSVSVGCADTPVFTINPEC